MLGGGTDLAGKCNQMRPSKKRPGGTMITCDIIDVQ